MKPLVIVKSAREFTKKYPITRGMIVYSILWPASNTFQQVFLRKDKPFDIKEPLRFSFYGCFISAPSMYANVKMLSYLVPAQNLKGAALKAFLHQVLYAPFAISSFYLGMTALEGKSWDLMVAEWKAKFLPTLKAGACIWPIVQFFNFMFVHERNRVPVIGTVSFFWISFLSYMKQLELQKAATAAVVL